MNYAILKRDGTHSIESIPEGEDLHEKIISDDKIACIITEEEYISHYKMWDGESWIYNWENEGLYKKLMMGNA